MQGLLAGAFNLLDKHPSLSLVDAIVIRESLGHDEPLLSLDETQKRAARKAVGSR